jgi:hypothetical protein
MAKRKWSQHVTETSDAMDLKPGVFESDDPEQIARSVASSAEHSKRRKATPFRSAMSMIVFYTNRAGTHLSKRRRQILERAKGELRKIYDRPPARSKRA